MRQVFSGRTHPMNPRLSPDGRQIAFVEGEFDGPALSYVMPSDGGNPVRIFPENKCCNEVDPTWSPDGKRLAVWVESPQEKIETEMRIVTLATREVSYLPRAPKRAWSPRWSPDGRYILCLTKPYPGTDGLEIYDFKTNKWKILLTEPGSGNWPSWSHDSRWIYYTGSNQGPGNRVKILRISVDGGAPEKIVDLQDFRATGYDLNWYGLDPEDNPLMLRDAGANEVYALTLER
jgi:Tol biopolymer transport system component